MSLKTENSKSEIREDNHDITASEPSKPPSKPPPQLNFTLPAHKDIGNIHHEWSAIQDSLLPVDLLLLTAIDPEFRTCYYYLEKPRRSLCPDLGYVYFGEFGDGKVKVALILCDKGASGPNASLPTARKAVEELGPRAVACVGCCGMVNPKKTKLGDVVISSKLGTYAEKKITRDGTEEWRGYKVHVSKNMSHLIPHAHYGWRSPLEKPEELEVDVHGDGVMLSGPELVNYQERRGQLLKQHPDALGLEMEGEGLYAASYNAGIEWVVIKGISDLADGSKTETKDWQPFACAMAASLVCHMFKHPVAMQHWPHYKKQGDTGNAGGKRGFNAMAAIIFVLVIFLAVAIPWQSGRSDGGEKPVEPTPSTPIIALEQFLKSIYGTKEGKKVYNGRTIQYSVSARIFSFEEPLVYDAKARDVAAGITVKKKHFETADEAIDAAIRELLKQLKERQIIE